MEQENRNSKPWYRKFSEKFPLAICLLHDFNNKWTSLKRESYSNFDSETKAHFIFESNNIEKEGLSLGDTKRLVFSEFISSAKITDDSIKNLKYLQESIHGAISPKVELNFSLPKFEIESPSPILSEFKDLPVKIVAKYGVHNKDVAMVLQYLKSIMVTETYTQKSIGQNFKSEYFRVLTSALDSKTKLDPEILSRFTKDLKEQFPNGKPDLPEPLLSEERIKSLHNEMATGLIDPDLTPAGEYRTHPIMTDLDSYYPAPQAVPEAMAFFIEQYNNFEKLKLNPIFLSAWASTRLVAIHPFSDFNGRLSRLVMNMILRRNLQPFWISMRSCKREKKKYFTALKHYHRNNLFPITTLISDQIITFFDQYNYEASLSNYPTIKPSKFLSSIQEQSKEEMLKCKWNILNGPFLD